MTTTTAAELPRYLFSKVAILTPPGFTSYLVCGRDDQNIAAEKARGGEIIRAWDVMERADGTRFTVNETRH